MTTLSINTVPNEILERSEKFLSSVRHREARPGQVPDFQDQLGDALRIALEGVGERFSLYDIMAQWGPTTPACLATQAGAPELPVRIWLEAQASGNYLYHPAKSDLYSLYCAWLPGVRNKSR